MLILPISSPYFIQILRTLLKENYKVVVFTNGQIKNELINKMQRNVSAEANIQIIHLHIDEMKYVVER